MKHLIIILAITLTATVCSADSETTISLVSKHFGNDGYKYNEVNPGVIQYWYNSPKYYTFAGAYKNSHSRSTFLAGVGHEWKNWCVEYGYVSGYENTKLAGQFCYRFNLLNQKFKFNFMPAKQIGIAASDVVSLQWVLSI